MIDSLIAYNTKRGSEGESIPDLCEAFLNYDIEKIEILLKLGHDINEEFNSTNALIQSSSLGYVDIVNLLLDYGANINYQTKQGFTALIFASQLGEYEIVKTLIKRGADKNIQGYQGFTALDVANLQENKNILALLYNSKSINSDYLKDLMNERAANDYKELMTNKIEELGINKATKYLENIMNDITEWFKVLKEILNIINRQDKSI